MKYYETLVFNSFGDCPDHRGISKSGCFNGYYGIQYNHSGDLQLSVNNNIPFTVSGPHAFFTFPGPWFTYGALNNGSRHHCYICFSGSLIQRLIAGGLFKLEQTNPLIKITHADKFYGSFKKLLQLLRQPRGGVNPRAAWMLEDLLLQLQEQPDRKRHINSFCEQKLSELLDKITRAPSKDWQFEEEAQKLSVSYSHFRRIFREVAGCPPNQFLLEARLDLAVHLLESETLPIAEVAHACGFSDEFYFSRIFKKHKLITPSSLRQY